MMYLPSDFEYCRKYWLDGRCPCCGAILDDDLDARAVAEGVTFCGRCIRNRHHDAEDMPGFLEEMLIALLPEGGKP